MEVLNCGVVPVYWITQNIPLIFHVKSIIQKSFLKDKTWHFLMYPLMKSFMYLEIQEVIHAHFDP